MNKRIIMWLLIAGGAVLIGLAVILALGEMSTMSIVGGADWPTFQFVFYHRNNGLYSNLAGIGGLGILTALIMGIAGKKKS